MGSQVILHVYDVTNSTDTKTNENILAINRVCREYLVLGGIFHGAVEINGEEWSYGYCPRGTGVFPCTPKENPMYQYRESIVLGPTCKDNEEVNSIIQQLKREWPGNRYDLLKRNCNHFCEEFCKKLQVGPVPLWVNRFANMGQASIDAYCTVSDQMEAARSSIQSTSASWYSYLFPQVTAPAVESGATGGGPKNEELGEATGLNRQEKDRATPLGINLPKFDAIPSNQQ